MTSTTAEPPFFGDAPHLAERAEGYVERAFAEIRRRPVRSLLIAVGTGYLTGGGLGTAFTARLLGVSARMALRLAVFPLFVSAVEQAMANRSATVLLPPNRNNSNKEMHS
ncbi:MAG TPA: hypothetical protein VHU40_10935 [Polyangia bacterium]|jgi:hypothetical protein|nr:hypothetical protein [Polyangia bacterium]